MRESAMQPKRPTPLRPVALDELCLTLADDGCGMESNTRTSRFGSIGMRGRVEMTGGTFLFESSPGRGMRAEAHPPANGGK